MSTSSIMHRPTSYAASAAVVALVAAGAVVVTLSGSPSTSVDPSVQDHPDTSHHHSVWHPTTSGGRVQLGE
jgi:FlaG/FlaF family flagellin (archaellin)